MKLENRLQDALRPVDPGEDFTASVLTAVRREVRAVERAPRSKAIFVWPSALAACLVAAVTVTIQVREAREREAGLRAREQVLEALQVTSEKLNLAYRVVHPASSSSDDETKTQKRQTATGGPGGA